MADLPHFLPFRIAAEIRDNFPLCNIVYDRIDANNYLIGFDSTETHPIYIRVRLKVQVNMSFILQNFSDAELCVQDILESLANTMHQRLRPNVTMGMLKKYAPWMNSPNFS